MSLFGSEKKIGHVADVADEWRCGTVGMLKCGVREVCVVCI